MISLNLKNAFEELEINDKKDKLNEELIFIGELIKKIQDFHDIDSDFQIKNYDFNSKMTEEQFLTFLYDDVFEIQNQLLGLIYNIQNK